MADVTELRCWPTCADAIDWSQDGIIALASDERVELLFPNTVSFERDQDAPQWQHVPLKVPLFSTDELPLKEPAPMQSYSIGQEISNSSPTAIAWSPSGLAKHRRCALAVLTGNLVLSLWASDGKPQDESSWNRRLIVNDALRKYYLAKLDEESYYAIPLDEEKLRLRSRIRAFAWAPTLPDIDRAGIVGTHLSYGQHIVAASNDDNHVTFIAIHSPTSSYGARKGWAAEILTHCSVTPDARGIITTPTSFEDIMEQQRHVSHLAWSPWTIQSGRYQSIIMYATNHNIRARIVTYMDGIIKLGHEIMYPDIQVRFNGPMKWSPVIEDKDKLRLALFTTTGLLCLTISTHDGSVIERFSHSLDGRWDEISGAVWDTAESKTRLHVSSLTSTLGSPTAILEVSTNELARIDSPSWKTQIENNLALFSVKNHLKGNGRARVWGLTRSPLGDFIAASSSVHPSDMIEYGPPADRRGTVAISTLRQYNQIRGAFPPGDVSAEGIVFTLKKLAGNLVEDAEQMPAFAEKVVDRLVQTYPCLQEIKNTADLSTLSIVSCSLHTMVVAFKQDAFLNMHSLKDRYTILVSRACNTGTSEELSRALIAYRLAATMLQYPQPLSQTPFSTEIRTHHQQLVTLINSLTNETLPETRPSSTEPETQQKTVDGTTSTGITPTSPTDTCDFCSAPIPFTDLNSAACTTGHTFPRCGLSFIAIQAPGITKYCGICSTPFLNDAFVAAQESVAPSKIGSVDDSNNNNNNNAGTNDNTGSASELVAENQPGEATVRASPQHTADEDGSQNGNEHLQDSQTTGAGEDDVDMPVTLARVLFLACDACIYCGGKFAG